MIYKVEKVRWENISPLLKNFGHELSVESVIKGNTPGEIYVDDIDSPKSGLIKTTECNGLFGDPANKVFNAEIREYIGYFDPLMCTDTRWNDHIYAIHPNTALRPYARKYYKLESAAYLCIPVKQGNWKIELIYPDSLAKINYANKNIITEWINITNISQYPHLCVGSVVSVDHKIVSCSGLDCFVEDRIEIGIKTEKAYRRNGYGKIAVAALVNESIKNGIKEIGWHCVSTNIGSQKIAERCGFRHRLTYEAFSPYPPIENDADLTMAQWEEYAHFLEEKAKDNFDHYWAASKCWAKAKNLPNTIKCINKLIEHKAFWFVQYLEASDEFKYFDQDREWASIRKSLTK